MRTLTIVSASGPGPEWDVESDVGSTGPAPGRWLSDAPIVRVLEHELRCVMNTEVFPLSQARLVRLIQVWTDADLDSPY